MFEASNVQESERVIRGEATSNARVYVVAFPPPCSPATCRGCSTGQTRGCRLASRAKTRRRFLLPPGAGGRVPALALGGPPPGCPFPAQKAARIERTTLGSVASRPKRIDKCFRKHYVLDRDAMLKPSLEESRSRAPTLSGRNIEVPRLGGWKRQSHTTTTREAIYLRGYGTHRWSLPRSGSANKGSISIYGDAPERR